MNRVEQRSAKVELGPGCSVMHYHFVPQGCVVS